MAPVLATNMTEGHTILVPGDMIEWWYIYDNGKSERCVSLGERRCAMWSSVLSDYVDISTRAIVVHVNDSEYTFLTHNGLFRFKYTDVSWHKSEHVFEVRVVV